jgi:hypothetical protein
MNLNEHENLIRGLQSQDPDVVLDGAVNNDNWSKTDVRILWILKETNEFPKDKDLRSLLREITNSSDPNKVYNRWKATYGLVAKVSYGLINNLKWDKWADDVDNLVKKERVLEKIAVININKRAGRAKSNHVELTKAAKEYRKVVLEQIYLLEPTVIILGGVAEIMQIVIADHPGARTNHKLYYDSVIKKLRK